MNIVVFLSAYSISEEYQVPAVKFARLMARAGHCLIYGGTNRGLMDEVCSAFLAEGGKVCGVIMESLLHLKRDGIEIEVVPTLYERKRRFLEKADAIVVLVGGIGTLDELTEVLEFKKHGAHGKPIAILNTENFYAGLRLQLERMAKEGFIPMSLADLVHFASTPEEALELVERQSG